MTPHLLRMAVALGLTGLLAWACYCDVTRRRLPNLASLAVMLLFIPWALTSGLAAIPGALAAFALAGAVSFALYLFGCIGAGDCKLFTSLALFSGMALLPHYAVATALSGGVVALGFVAANPTKNFLAWQTRGAVTASRGVPYGLAIAAGALIVVWVQAIGQERLLVDLFAGA